MQNLLRTVSAVMVFGAGLALLPSAARADEPKPKHHHHAARSAEKATVAREKSTHMVAGANGIPTRDDRESREVNGGSLGGANGSEYRVQTGTNIPKHYNRRGYTTDSDQNSFIYDKNDQRLRSHDNLSEGLRDVPSVQVRGAFSK